MYDAQENQAQIAPIPVGCGPVLPVLGRDTTTLRQQVFEHVRAAGRAARADITRALGISAGSTTALTADLISRGMLREVDGLAREQGRGRPPVALELSDETHTAVLTDLSGNVLADASLATAQPRKDVDVILDEMDALITQLLSASGKSMGEINAVGVGLTGIVDHMTGTVAWSPLLTAADTDLKSAFSQRHSCPLYVDNDANMLTLAELWFGAGRELSNFAVVTIEHGVGMGLVLDNRLFRGSRGMGLELGHTKVQLDGALCRCGQRGCLEAYLADYALAREAGTALDRGPRNLQSPNAMLEMLYAQAKAGNKSASTIFQRAGRYLSVALSNVVQLF
uniref:ROK family protein n=1 Tax=Yoonia sp. TaxID=2212373 RepID=UPI004047DD03